MPAANPKLILIEGVPGSGKTSTARFVCDWLASQGRQTALFLEGDWNHPADYESVACLDENQFAALKDQFPAWADFLTQHARLDHGDWFISYRKLQHEHGGQAPEALFAALAQYEIYELPAEKYQRLILLGWQNFTSRALAENQTYVFECCFLQNPLTTLLAHHNLPEAAVRQFVLELAEIIRPLQPVLIHLTQSDVENTLEKVRGERPQAWADFVTGYITGREYGQVHNLNGFAGIIQFYAARQALELELLPALPFLTLPVPDLADWAARYQIVTAGLLSVFPADQGAAHTDAKGVN